MSETDAAVDTIAPETLKEQLDAGDIESEAARQEAADQKRWMNFLQQALGHDDGSPRRGSL